MNKLFTVFLFAMTLSLSNEARAELIDVDINNDGNFSGFSLDQDGYQLEWLDFGINNDQSYNHVVAGLQDGWRVASESEVTFLWARLFLNTADDSETQGYGENGFAAATAARWQGNYSLWLSYVDIMGKNSEKSPNSSEALGWFEADDGKLTAAQYWIVDDADGDAMAKLDTDYDGREDGWENNPDASFSTFVVREKLTQVPAPPTILLALASLCFCLFRRRVR